MDGACADLISGKFALGLILRAEPLEQQRRNVALGEIRNDGDNHFSGALGAPVIRDLMHQADRRYRDRTHRQDAEAAAK